MLIELVEVNQFFVLKKQELQYESTAAPALFNMLFLNHLGNSITRELNIKPLISDDYFV